MAGGTDASWQVTLATLVTGVGIVVNGSLTAYNAQRTSAGKRLDHFNSVVRRPCELELGRIGLCGDNAEDFILDPADPPASLKQIWREFHGARRNLERILQYAQNADDIPGLNWVSLQDEEADRATDALDAALSASAAGNQSQANAQLEIFRRECAALRHKVLDRIDRNAKCLNSLVRWFSRAR